MADPIYHRCSVCKEPTKHTAPSGSFALCRDTRCREITLGREAALADTHKYLTEKLEEP